MLYSEDNHTVWQGMLLDPNQKIQYIHITNTFSADVKVGWQQPFPYLTSRTSEEIFSAAFLQMMEEVCKLRFPTVSVWSRQLYITYRRKKVFRSKNIVISFIMRLKIIFVVVLYTYVHFDYIKTNGIQQKLLLDREGTIHLKVISLSLAFAICSNIRLHVDMFVKIAISIYI